MTRLASLLLNWYRKNKRSLPWRESPTPYSIWVSEIMLQQTRVETVIPYFDHWMKIFPDISSLAAADERQVLNAWEGLGYYSRARNLHKAARAVVQKFHGDIPATLEGLRSLPGIGRYTAGAIASMAFGLDASSVDGNVRRVIARLYDVSQRTDTPAGEEILWSLSAENLPTGRAGEYNQALMDLGATICTPNNPDCTKCPLRGICKARRRGTQGMRPVLGPKKRTPHFTQVAAVIIRRGRVLMIRRPEKGLLAGMWEFPNVRVAVKPVGRFERSLKRAHDLEVRRGRSMGVIHHAYTHFKVTEHVFLCETSKVPATGKLKWVRLTELNDYPMGRIDRQIAGML